MQFSTPTTKAELYETLNEIYFHYRLRIDAYDGLNLSPLELTRMTFTPLSDEQLYAKAEILVAAAQEKRTMDYVDSIAEKKRAAEESVSGINDEYAVKKTETEKYYAAAKEAVKKQAVKTGVASSGIYAEKLSELEKEKGERLAAINAQKTARLTAINAKIQNYESLISDADNKFQSIIGKEIEAKFTELKDEQIKTLRYVFEYNNQLDEKEQRYENTRKQLVSSSQLRHLEIRTNGLTKDELVQNGYYNDAIKCVTDYYGTMSAAAAYSDIKSEPKLAIYLDDYYTDIVYFFKVNAT